MTNKAIVFLVAVVALLGLQLFFVTDQLKSSKNEVTFYSNVLDCGIRADGDPREALNKCWWGVGVGKSSLSLGP